MNFVRFPANATNIFPIANSKTGGQLLTEFNLRSRESVESHSSVKYMIGQSFCHSMDDFWVQKQESEDGAAVSSTALQITSGRAVVNGHFIESLVDVTVDLAEANKELRSEGLSPLVGHLAVGLRAMYSTEQTLSASMRVENKQNLMAGIQIVILPYPESKKDYVHGYFLLPEDVPDQEDLVSAHILLADFYYTGGTINKNQITNNKAKIQSIDADRVGNFEKLLEAEFVTRTGLNPKKIYTMAGKSEGDEPLTNKSTWCDSTDSLMVWHKASKLTETLEAPLVDQAEFGTDKDENVTLTIPHKFVDGMQNASGHPVYYEPRIMNLPKADYSKNTPGTISSAYTKSIKSISAEIEKFKHFEMPLGKQRGYLQSLETREDLPSAVNNWRMGDYIIVASDDSVATSGDQPPSTMYVVVPPYVTEVTYAGTSVGVNKPPAGLNGVNIAGSPLHQEFPGDETQTTYQSWIETLEEDGVIDVYREQINPETGETERVLVTSNKDNYNDMFGISYTTGEAATTGQYRGFYLTTSPDTIYVEGGYIPSGVTPSGETTKIPIPDFPNEQNVYTYQDYLTVAYDGVPTVIDGQTTYTTLYIYYMVTKTASDTLEFSDPIILTGPIQLATEDMIGGFRNVSETNLDMGYVYRDETGNLRLLDYALLRSGVLAYRLGEDYSTGSGLSSGEIQTELDEYVNERVAFPTQEQIAASIAANIPTNQIQLNLELSPSEEYGTIDIKNIDSRWGTFVNIIISGNATKNTTINISNCEKIKITLDINSMEASSSGPIINLYNSGLYYDASVIDYIHTCPREYISSTSSQTTSQPLYEQGFNGIENLSLWYEKFDELDAELVVNDMTITEVKTPVIPEEIDFWSEEVVNDYHFYYGLQSVTLDHVGNVVGCGIYIRNDTTGNIELSPSMTASSFVLPQGSGFSYPESGLVKPMKITGDFITAYSSSDPDGYTIIDTKFTVLTQKYIYNSGDPITEKGTISFYIDPKFVTNFLLLGDFDSGTPIDGWESNSYHVFEGWVIG